MTRSRKRSRAGRWRTWSGRHERPWRHAGRRRHAGDRPGRHGSGSRGRRSDRARRHHRAGRERSRRSTTFWGGARLPGRRPASCAAGARRAVPMIRTTATAAGSAPARRATWTTTTPTTATKTRGTERQARPPPVESAQQTARRARAAIHPREAPSGARRNRKPIMTRSGEQSGPLRAGGLSSPAPRRCCTASSDGTRDPPRDERGEIIGRLAPAGRAVPEGLLVVRVIDLRSPERARVLPGPRRRAPRLRARAHHAQASSAPRPGSACPVPAPACACRTAGTRLPRHRHGFACRWSPRASSTACSTSAIRWAATTRRPTSRACCRSPITCRSRCATSACTARPRSCATTSPS